MGPRSPGSGKRTRNSEATPSEAYADEGRMVPATAQATQARGAAVSRASRGAAVARAARLVAWYCTQVGKYVSAECATRTCHNPFPQSIPVYF